MLRAKFLRIDKGLTLSQVSARAKLHRSTINNIENGRTVPRGTEVARIAKALGCDPARLLDHVACAALGDGAEHRDAVHECSIDGNSAADVGSNQA